MKRQTNRTGTATPPCAAFKAESIEKIKSRLEKAKERVWTYEELEAATMKERKQHMFDFEDGVRMIVLREAWRTGGRAKLIQLHLAFVPYPGSGKARQPHFVSA